MSNIQLDYSDITDIFKEKLKIDNIKQMINNGKIRCIVRLFQRNISQ